MMERFKFFMVLSVIALLITWSNCTVDNDSGRRKVIGEGPVVMQVIPADTFSIFSHLAIGNVNITTGDSLEVYIQAQQNVLDEMGFEFKDGYFAWGLEDQVDIVDSDTILLTIHMPNAIDAVQVGGVGTVNIQGEKQDDILIEVLGFAEINSYSLEVDNCDLNILGHATCWIQANNRIAGTISGIGNIYYRGNPELLVSIIGQGDLFDDN